ncbi:hypothetical protein DDE82_008059 [Stemphylium lycopersici]|uniref:Uncharacterized protein n=1 Tax=Stemphylium lycopersici TaxID=183478 RepID=A0A364N1M8_STELY|nr:hypothetical protein TW65_01295 [Stemphylium lycopersici]RAQ99642.1 hypothetical protein DDE82_008059 [Stemphylium lycopersici]RAR09404.1 hypothetical protein DDE83_005558 [Stemphylium lycopersici]
MSANAQPITYASFAEAIQDLPMDVLYAKYSEITNQLNNLLTTNAQLEQFVKIYDDKECEEALAENREVIKRFEERKDAIKFEVRDVRGLPWRPREDEDRYEPTSGGSRRGQRNGRGRRGEEEGGVYL